MSVRWKIDGHHHESNREFSRWVFMKKKSGIWDLSSSLGTVSFRLPNRHALPKRLPQSHTLDHVPTGHLSQRGANTPTFRLNPQPHNLPLQPPKPHSPHRSPHSPRPNPLLLPLGLLPNLCAIRTRPRLSLPRCAIPSRN